MTVKDFEKQFRQTAPEFLKDRGIRARAEFLGQIIDATWEMYKPIISTAIKDKLEHKEIRLQCAMAEILGVCAGMAAAFMHVHKSLTPEEIQKTKWIVT